jgi:hypothetical protein
MRHRVVTAASVLSLLLFAVLLAAWVGSWVDGVAVADGKLVAFRIATGDPDGSFVALQHDWAHRSNAGVWRVFRRGAKMWHGWAGFGFGGGKAFYTVEQPGLRSGNNQSLLYSENFQITFQLVSIPLWALLPLLAVLPAWRARSWRLERHRRRFGLCAACGYDLKGNASGVCPECGTCIRKQPEMVG